MPWKPWSLVFRLSHQLQCKANLASTVLSLMDLMWPCLVGPVEKTRLLHISQGLNLVWVRNAHMLAFPELNWCLEPRTSAGRNVNSRRSSANPRRSKKAQRGAKRKFVAQPELSHEAAELILRNQAARTDEKFPGTIHVSHHLALLHGHENVFFCTQCGAVNAGGALRLLKSQCDGSGESRQKARRKLERGFMPNEHVVADAKRAFLSALSFSLMLLDVYRASSMSLVIKKKKTAKIRSVSTAQLWELAIVSSMSSVQNKTWLRWVVHIDNWRTWTSSKWRQLNRSAYEMPGTR